MPLFLTSVIFVMLLTLDFIEAVYWPTVTKSTHVFTS